MKNNKTMRRKQVAMVVRPQKGTTSPEGRRNMAEGCLSRHCREFSNPCKMYETTKNTSKTQKGNPHQKSTTVIPTEFKGKNIFYFMYQKDSCQARPADHSCLPLCVEGSYKPWKKIKDKQRGTRKWKEGCWLDFTLQGTPTKSRPDARGLLVQQAKQATN